MQTWQDDDKWTIRSYPSARVSPARHQRCLRQQLNFNTTYRIDVRHGKCSCIHYSMGLIRTTTWTDTILKFRFLLWSQAKAYVMPVNVLSMSCREGVSRISMGIPHVVDYLVGFTRILIPLFWLSCLSLSKCNYDVVYWFRFRSI